MQWMLVSFLGCIIAQVVGFVTVVVSMHLFVVPKFDKLSWKRTRCYVRNITISFLDTNYHGDFPHIRTSNITKQELGYEKLPHSETVGSSVAQCTHVYVEYETGEGTSERGLLHSGGQAEAFTNHCNSSQHVSPCHYL